MNRRRLKKALKRVCFLPQNKSFPLYIWNKARHLYFKTIRSTKVAYPSTIMIELTNHCNLECTICPREYKYGKEMDKGKMDVEQAKRIIDEVHPYLDSIGLTGMGETFLYKELPEIVDYIKRKNKGIIISVSTNAVLPSIVSDVKKVVRKLDTIQISIDGLNETYNSIRINSEFKLLDQNIKILSELCENNSTDLMLNMVVTKENYKHMAELVAYADDVGVKYLDFTIFNLASVTDLPLEYYKFYKSDEFLKALGELNTAINQSNQVTVTNKNFSTDNSFQKCPFPWSHFYITQDNYLPPCCAKPFPKEKNFGSIENKKLIEVLNGNEFRKWRTLWHKNITPEFCNKCHFVDLEQGE